LVVWVENKIEIKIKIKIKGFGLTASGFAFGELLDKAPSNQGLVLLVWPFLRQGSFTPVSLRGPAAIRHPWRGAALAASMPLGPLRETSVQPAPKSRLGVSGLFAYEDHKQITSFPAEAGPTGARGLISGTGFSREEARSDGT
jgi:hypothetical protein